MRYLISILAGALMISGAVSARTLDGGNNGPKSGSGNSDDPVKIVVSPELKPLVDGWITGFSKTNPLVGFRLTETTDGSTTAEKGTIYFLTENTPGGMSEKLDWQLTVGHNSVIPVVSLKNSRLSDLVSKGVTPEALGRMLREGMKWSDITGEATDQKVNVYIKDNQGIADLLSGFSGNGSGLVTAVIKTGREDFLNAVENDMNGIGFCRLSDVKNGTANELAAGIALLPIDRNKNGRIDNFENIYGTPDDLSRGIWIGKYPKALSGSIYAMSAEKPSGNNELSFISWIFSDGGKYLAENGFTELTGTAKESMLASIAPAVTSAATETRGAQNIWITLLLCIAVAGLLFAIALGFAKRGSPAQESVTRISSGMNPGMVNAPAGLLYDRSHTWAFMEKDGLIRMGVDDFLQHVTGDLTKIILKEPGTFVRRGEQILTLVKDGKQLNLYAPVSGLIKAQNTDLYLDSSIINSSPYSDGWVYLIEPRNWARELQLMFMSDKYTSWIQEEFIRLKNFFAETLIPNPNLPGYIIMQDGGELKENPLADLDPEVWEEFQTRFIDVSK